MLTQFAYRCPLCKHDIVVADNVVGEIVDCPNCDSPVRVEVPIARPTERSDIDSDAATIDHAKREENQLACVHPAMFRKHPLWFITYSALAVVGIAGMIWAATSDEPLILTDWFVVAVPVQLVICGLMAGCGLVFLASWWLQSRYTELQITNKRTILRKGFIARSTTEVQHDDVRNIQVDQNIYERLVGVGDVAVSSSGQDDLEIAVFGIPQPTRVAGMIRELQ